MTVAKLLGIEGRYDTLGFYVDVGAHHPYRYSNTYYFYQRGWRGLNIDARKGVMVLFDKSRPRDISIEAAVARDACTLEFVEFNDPALSSCDANLTLERNGQNGHKIVGRRKVQAFPLRSILDRWMPKGQLIDFLTVDIEGLDLDALQSNDWETWRPKLVITEDGTIPTIVDISASPLAKFMSSQGYVCLSKLSMSLIFADTKRLKSTALGLRVE